MSKMNQKEFMTYVTIQLKEKIKPLVGEAPELFDELQQEPKYSPP